ncbi:MAG: GNAT family N-acetyltransferase [Thermoanaerobaculia bacterium]|nr:GNAT family N-acetyltransferase [Thermoanaerobaculia bacterium]
MIRALDERDLDALLEIWGDPSVMRYMAHPPLADRAATADFLAGIDQGWREKTLFQWGVAWRENGEVIGTVTLAELEWTHRRAEIGFALARRHWRRGVMGEAVRAVLDYAFGPLGLHRIEADTDPRNQASMSLLEGLGFLREGFQRERYFDLGEIQDAMMFGLLAREWRERTEQEG